MGRKASNKKKPISRQEEEQWLEDLEAGKGITLIAHKAKRDIRVVKNHIEIVRIRRLKEQAERDHYKDLIMRHQEDLLEEAVRLKQEAAKYPPVVLEPAGPINRIIYEALKQHLKRHRLLSLLQEFGSAKEKYEASDKTVTAELVEKETSLSSDLPEGIKTYPWTSRIMELLQQGLILKEDEMPKYDERKADDGTCKPIWNAYNLTESSISASDSKQVINAHKKLLDFAVTYLPQFAELRQRISELAQLILHEVNTLLVKHIVSGKCEFCPV